MIRLKWINLITWADCISLSHNIHNDSSLLTLTVEHDEIAHLLLRSISRI